MASEQKNFESPEETLEIMGILVSDLVNKGIEGVRNAQELDDELEIDESKRVKNAFKDSIETLVTYIGPTITDGIDISVPSETSQSTSASEQILYGGGKCIGYYRKDADQFIMTEKETVDFPAAMSRELKFDVNNGRFEIAMPIIYYIEDKETVNGTEHIPFLYNALVYDDVYDNVSIQTLERMSLILLSYWKGIELYIQKLQGQNNLAEMGDFQEAVQRELNLSGIDLTPWIPFKVNQFTTARSHFRPASPSNEELAS